MQKKLKTQAETLLTHPGTDAGQVLANSRIESHIFGRKFASSFSLPSVNSDALAAIVNGNLKLIQKVFAVSNWKQELGPSASCRPRSAQMDLSSEGFSILMHPFEVLFVCLNKVGWNEELKRWKKNRIFGKIGMNGDWQNSGGLEIVRESMDQMELANIESSLFELFEAMTAKKG